MHVWVPHNTIVPVVCGVYTRFHTEIVVPVLNFPLYIVITIWMTLLELKKKTVDSWRQGYLLSSSSMWVLFPVFGIIWCYQLVIWCNGVVCTFSCTYYARDQLTLHWQDWIVIILPGLAGSDRFYLLILFLCRVTWYLVIRDVVG